MIAMESSATLLVLTTQDLNQGLFALLGTYALHSTLLFASAWAMSKVLKSPRIRDLLWKGALVGALLTTGAAASLGGGPLAISLGSLGLAGAPPAVQDLGSPGEVIGFQGKGGAIHAGEEAAALGASLSVSEVKSALPGKASASSPVLSWLLVLWLCAVAFQLARVVRERSQAKRLIARSTPITGGPMVELLGSLQPPIRSAVRLSSCSNLKSPLAWGKSMIVIPDYFIEELDDQSLLAMLAHECEHLARRDGAWLLTARVLQSVFVFQPLQSLAIRQLSAQAELLCDEAAMRKRGGGVALAKCLATIADRLTSPQAPNFVPTMASTSSQLMGRVERALSVTPAPLGRRRSALVVALGAGALFTLACAGPVLVANHVEDPAAAAVAELPMVKGDLLIVITSDGKSTAFASVNEHEVGAVSSNGGTDRSPMDAYLSALYAQDSERALIIEAGKEVVYGEVVSTLDSVIRAGFTEVTFRGSSSDMADVAERYVLDPASDFFIGSGAGAQLSADEQGNLAALGYLADGVDREVTVATLSRMGYVDDAFIEDSVEANFRALGYVEDSTSESNVQALADADLTIVIGEDNWARIGDQVLLTPDQKSSPGSLQVLKEAIASFERVPIMKGLPLMGIDEVVRIQAAAGVPFERIQRVLMLCAHSEILAWNTQLDLGMTDGRKLIIPCPLPRDLDEVEEELELDAPVAPFIDDVTLKFKMGQVSCIAPGMKFKANPMALDAALLEQLAAMGELAAEGDMIKRVRVESDASTDCATVAEVLKHFGDAGEQGRILFVGAF